MQELHNVSEAAQWLRSRVTGSLHTDSRSVGPGDGLLAWPGARHDARSDVAAARARGTAACLVEAAGAEAFALSDPHIAAFAGLKAGSGPIADAFFDHPSHALHMIAVTGTNGKTSTVWWLAQALAALPTPWPCAMVGTLGMGFPVSPAAGPAGATPGALHGSGLTTPDAVQLQYTLHDFVRRGAVACAIEASSIGLAEHRLDGTRVHTAVFTNLTQDHLDYHGDMQSYWRAKERLFYWPGLRSAVVNIDDPAGATLAAALQSRGLDLWTVSCQGEARLRASEPCLGPQGLGFRISEGSHSLLLQTAMIGLFNVYNLLAVVAAMRSLGVRLDEAVAACQHLAPVPGRMQCIVEPGKPMVVVDYAHTPDALEKAIAALRPVAQQRGGRLWCVFGCGGDRDPLKRPLMGRAAAAADHVVLTSDNPRSEEPLAIMAQIAPGLQEHPALLWQPDRAAAIVMALRQAQATDVVLVAGKGHERSQEIGGRRIPFSDQEQVQQALHQWHTSRPNVASGVAA